MDAIRPIDTLLRSSGALGAADSAKAPDGESFGDRMAAALEKTDQLLSDADRSARGVAEGSADAVEALIALSKAELALRHVVSMSTRAVDAYREVMRMQL
jgi:flagellar hook-basal body complex protein FliE